MAVKKSLVKKAIVASKKKAPAVVEVKKEVVAEVAKEQVKADKKYLLTIGLKDLLMAGCHLGHKVSKTNPKSKENIYVVKDGISIIDLTATFKKLQEATDFIYNAKRNGKQIALLGTKRQAREIVKRVAIEAGVPYITDRWLGGTISNWGEIKKNIKKLNDLNAGMAAGKFANDSKKDQSIRKKEMTRLNKIVGGLLSLDKLFDVLFLVDVTWEKTAIRECADKGIKVVAICDTDSNPQKVDIGIPANDDNVKSISLIVEEIGKAIKAAGTK
jgi:small subunit ribosomal protein S2